MAASADYRRSLRLNVCQGDNDEYLERWVRNRPRQTVSAADRPSSTRRTGSTEPGGVLREFGSRATGWIPDRNDADEAIKGLPVGLDVAQDSTSTSQRSRKRSIGSGIV